MDVLLWGVLPYLMLAVLVGGTIWRYRYDQFGWTTRSSQLYESRLLRIGSPLFHFGILVVIVGHFGGLVIPKTWTDAAGVSRRAVPLRRSLLGQPSPGVATLVGVAILIYRRRTTGPVFMATTTQRQDRCTWCWWPPSSPGLATTVLSVVGPATRTHTYRETVSPWFRSLFILQPDVASMAAAPFAFQLHTLIGMLLFAIWPFTRLVHAFTAPSALPVPPLHRLPQPRRPAPTRRHARAIVAGHPVGTRDRDAGARK